jgi:Arc/MetJ-type ribon-helix-helix transcriptional regulator
MTIHLSKQLESEILAVVNSGRYASLDDAMAAAASLLLARVNQEQAQAKQPSAPVTHKPILSGELISVSSFFGEK